MNTRMVVKILHTLASAGLIGGLFAYMVLLAAAPQDSAAAYADLRASIAAISNWVLLPSLAVALVTGLASMVVHGPFRDKSWAWIKAALGILMFKGVLTIVSAKADYAATVSARQYRSSMAATRSRNSRARDSLSSPRPSMFITRAPVSSVMRV
ncbi:MAG: DUF2269 family protein [Gammaproteobacteria bacterium]|jgi:uncharacterized membrane protein|nr:DUF2269 family protein [Gammaproteobacteria bacterium]